MRFEMILTTCPFCGTGCNFYLQVIDGKITDLVPCKTDPVSEGQLCVLGRNCFRFIYNKDRLLKPMIRSGDSFVEATWPKAYERIAENFRRIRETYGPDAIAVLSSAKCTNEENYLIMKFTRGVLGTNNIDHCARLCHASSVTGLTEAFGSGSMTNSIVEIENADCIMVVGSNTTGQHPIIASKMMKAKSRGAKLIVIDPRKIPLAASADVFLKLRPGTNVALLNGILNCLIEKGLVNETFVRERTEGFEYVKEKVREYSLGRVSEITGVRPDLIEGAALVYGQAKSAMILYAMGVTQHSTGTDQVKALANLAMATGNIGRPSTGVNPLRGHNNVQGACDMGALPNVLTGYQGITDPEVRGRFEREWGLPLPDKPGLTVVEMLDAARNGIIKAMMIVGENPMVSDPDINHVKEALEALEFLVVQDIFMTETAQFADIVLPACSFAEKEGTFTATDRRVQRVRKAIDPIGESKPDWLIISELAKEMGCDAFNYASPREIMKEISSLTPSYRGISYERLDRGDIVHWPCPDDKHPGTPVLHKEGFIRGKGKFHAIDYLPPAELPDEEYPYLLTTGRLPFHFHTGSITRKIERLDQEVPTGVVEINPEDARLMGICSGDRVRVISRRGEISIRARLSEEIAPGIVFIPMHFAECAANYLTDTVLDPDAKIPPFKVCAVRIEKERPKEDRSRGEQ